MERRKTEVQANYNRLKEECTSLVNLLNTLLERHQKSVKIVENMRPEDILKSSNYFLNVSRCQYEAVERILTINLDLESYLMLEPIPTPKYNDRAPRHYSDESDASTNFFDKTADNSNTTEDKPNLRLNTPSRRSSSSSNSSGDDGSQPIVHNNDPTADCWSGQNENSNVNDVVASNATCIINVESSNSGSDLEKCSDSKTMSRASSRRTVESNDLTDDDRISSECSETVADKLNKRKCTSRQQRYLKNLKRPPMPDLSFTVVPYNSSTEFCSATDGELDVLASDSDVNYQESYHHSVIKDAEPLEVHDKCVISHVVSPSEFYVNKLHVNHDQFEHMVSQLERLGKYFKKFPSKKAANLNINKFCMAYSAVWESWNRAEIVDWHLNATPNTDVVEVQYVDYGDYETVPYYNLRTLPHELTEKPRLAVKCHLAYLYPPGSSAVQTLDKWPESSIETTKELLSSPDILYNILFVEKSGDTYGIDLVRDGESDNEKTIGQKLIDANKAVEIFRVVPTTIQNSFMKEQLKTAQGMSGITNDMNMDEIMQRLCDNVLVNESDRLEEAITGYAAQDEARMCRFMKNGSCFKGANCKQDHEGLSKDGVTTDKQLIYTKALTTLPNPQIGQDLKVIITSVCSVNKFYGQIRSYDVKGESLKALSNALNSNSAVHQPLKILPANGEIVIAKYCDNKWYRAKVCDITTSSEVSDVLVKVFFVDYGDVLDVQFKDLRQITEKYLHLPFQAVRFHINNIMPKKGSDVKKAIEYFEEFFLFKIFTVSVIYVASGFIEVLVSNRDNEDVGTHLIDVGHAESKIISFLPLENGKFLVD